MLFCLVLLLAAAPHAIAGGRAAEVPQEAAKQISIGVFDRGQIPPEEGSMENNRWTRMLQELIGPEIDLEFRAYQRREALEQWDVELAVGRAPDLLSTYYGAWVRQKASSGRALRLDPLLKHHAPDYVEAVGWDFIEKYGHVAAYGYLEEGIYLLPSRRDHTSQDVLWIRADWMDRLGLEPPTTAEEFGDLARAFARDDPDGNGRNDTAGVALTHRLINLVFAAYGIKYGSVAMPYNVLDGEIVLAHEMPGFWDAVRYMRQLYDEGLVDSGLVRPSYDQQADELAMSGRLGIFARNVDWGARLLAANRDQTENARWTVIPLFESDGWGRHPYLETFEASLTGLIAASAEHPEAVLRYVDLQADPDVQALITHGIEGVHYELADGVPVEIDPQRNEREQAYARNSSYLILRGPNIDGPEAALRWAEQARDPFMREGYRLQALALSLLDDPYAYPRFDYAVHMPHTSTYHEALRNDLESLVIKTIVGGRQYGLDDARAELDELLERNHYAEVKWELNEFSDISEYR